MQGPSSRRPQSEPPPGRYAWILPAFSAGLTVVVGILLVEAWRRFALVAKQAGMDVSTRKIYTFVLVVSAVFLLWRTWFQGRRALRLWREGRR